MGGEIVLGGNQNTDDKGKGRFFEPTIIANANNGMRSQTEQFFGPVVTFQEVDDDKQALELINSTKYGVGSSIFTKCPNRIDFFSQKLKVGVVNIN